VCPPEWHKQQLEGYPIAYAIEEKLAEYPDFEKEIKWYYGQYDVHVRNPEYGMLGLLQQLFHMDKYKGYVLANWPAETYQLLLENYKFYFLRWFKGIVLSGAEGISKPDPRLFQILIDRYSLNVNETLYIDDDQRNLDVAKQLGMHTLLYYEGIEKVIDQLQDIYDIAT
jgi:2-haloacid dehalogenase